jgi:hypothetical protein
MMNPAARAALIISALLSLGISAVSEAAQLLGTVTAQPRVEAKSDGAGDGLYGDRGVRYAHLFDYKHLKNMVVYAEPLAAPKPSTLTPQDVHASIRIERMGSALHISPAFVVLPIGAALEVRNETSRPVTLFTGAESADSFSLAVEPGRQQRVLLDAIGLCRLLLLEDPQAQAKVFVAGPYFSVLDDQGHYSMELPAGAYRVTAWHERLPSQNQEVSVTPGETATRHFSLSVMGQLPEVK